MLSVSLVTCDLGVMLEITGGNVPFSPSCQLFVLTPSGRYAGVSATALAYIFPAICFLKLSADSTWKSRNRISAVACAAFGGIVLVLSVMLTLRKAWSDAGVPKVCS
jgi:solute carrier family 38 (sodium-coupled neutral amino acid transporter), member 11